MTGGLTNGKGESDPGCHNWDTTWEDVDLGCINLSQP